MPGLVESCARVLCIPTLDAEPLLGGRSNAKTRGVYPLLGLDALVAGVASFSTTVCSTATWSGLSAPGSAGSFVGSGLLAESGPLAEPGLFAEPDPVGEPGLFGESGLLAESGTLGAAGAAASDPVLLGVLSGATGAPVEGSTGTCGAFEGSDCSGVVTGSTFSADRGAG